MTGKTTAAILKRVVTQSGIVDHLIDSFLYLETAREFKEGEHIRAQKLFDELSCFQLWVANDIDAARQRLNRVNAPDSRRTKFHPSSVSKCPRYTFMHMLGASDEMITHDPHAVGRTQRIFTVGDMIHYRYCTLLYRMKLLLGRECPMEIPELNMTGRADMLLAIPEDCKYKETGHVFMPVGGPKTKYIVDTKSANDRSFTSMVREGKGPEAYESQVQCYNHAFDCDGLLLCENKNTSEIAEFPVIKSASAYKEIVDTVRGVETAIKRLDPPDRIDCQPNRFPCAWCAKRDLCWDNQGFSVWMETVVKGSHNPKSILHKKKELVPNEKASPELTARSKAAGVSKANHVFLSKPASTKVKALPGFKKKLG